MFPNMESDILKYGLIQLWYLFQFSTLSHRLMDCANFWSRMWKHWSQLSLFTASFQHHLSTAFVNHYQLKVLVLMEYIISQWRCQAFSRGIHFPYPLDLQPFLQEGGMDLSWHKFLFWLGLVQLVQLIFPLSSSIFLLVLDSFTYLLDLLLRFTCTLSIWNSICICCLLCYLESLRFLCFFSPVIYYMFVADIIYYYYHLGFLLYMNCKWILGQNLRVSFFF